MAFKIPDLFPSLSNSGSPFDDGTGEFLPIDVEVAKKHLRLAELAHENGEKSQPSATRSTKDAMAKAIDTHIADLVRMAKDKFQNRLNAIDELSKAHSSSLQYIAEIYENGRAELKATARKHYGSLFTAKRDWVLGEDEITSFRKKHGRIGPARYPVDKTKIFGLIFLIAIVEIMTNAYALGEAHPSGPIGVVMEIFMFGIANVGVAFLLGCYVWRYFFHISFVQKMFATLLAIPMTAFILFLNFFLAHYRDAISKLADNDLSALQMMTLMQKLGGQARDTLVHNPFVMDDFKSYLLLFVGVLASTFATKKSFELDDPYPGYGKISREQNDLAFNFNNDQTLALNEMNNLVDDFSGQINTQVSIIKAGDERVSRRENDKKQLQDKYNNWLAVTESVGEALYAFYREENMKARKDQKEPKCFITTNFSLRGANVKLPVTRRRRTDHSKLERTARKYVDDLNSTSDEFQKHFKDIENMSEDKVLAAKFKEPTVFRD